MTTIAAATPTGDVHDELRSGWGGSKKEMDSTSAFAQNFKPEEHSQIIAFLEDEPYVGYRRHWVDRTRPRTGKSTRSYTCLQTHRQGLPAVQGRRSSPQAVSAFNIVLLDNNGDVALKSWDVRRPPVRRR